MSSPSRPWIRRGLRATFALAIAASATAQAGQFCDDQPPYPVVLPSNVTGAQCPQLRHTPTGGVAPDASAQPYSSALFLHPAAVDRVRFLLDMSALSLGDKSHPNAQMRVFELGFGVGTPSAIKGAPAGSMDYTAGLALTLTVSGAEDQRVLSFDQLDTPVGLSPSLSWGIGTASAALQTVAVPAGVSRVWIDLYPVGQWQQIAGTVRLYQGTPQTWSTPRPVSFNIVSSMALQAQPLYILSGVVDGDISPYGSTTYFRYESPVAGDLE